MTLNEYLNSTKYKAKISTQGQEKLGKIGQEILEWFYLDRSIDLKEVPKIVIIRTINFTSELIEISGVTYIIVNENVFGDFGYLNYIYNNNEITKNQKYSFFIKLISKRFLTLGELEISHYLSEEYKLIEKIEFEENDKLLDKTIADELFVQFLYIILHEAVHHLFRKEKISFSSLKEGQINLFSNYLKLDEHYEKLIERIYVYKEFFPKTYIHFPSNLEDCFFYLNNYFIQNNKLIEECLCDLWAFFSTIKVFETIIPNYMKEEHIIKIILLTACNLRFLSYIDYYCLKYTNKHLDANNDFGLTSLIRFFQLFNYDKISNGERLNNLKTQYENKLLDVFFPIILVNPFDNKSFKAKYNKSVVFSDDWYKMIREIEQNLKKK